MRAIPPGRVRRSVLAAVAVGAGLVGVASASEREIEQGVPGGSARDYRAPIQRVFPRIARREPIFTRLSEKLDTLPDFFSKTEIGANFATFYKRGDRAEGGLDEAWVMGGSVYYRSGWLADVLRFEVEGFTSQPVVAKQDRDGTLLLEDRQNSYTVLGIANARLESHGVRLTGYRQYLDLPYLNRRLNRLTPNTFESITLEKFEGPIRFTVGHTWRIKQRNSDEFQSMARAAGVPKDRGLIHAGLLWSPNEDVQTGAIMGHLRDVATVVYGETNLVRTIAEDLELRLDLQLTVQREHGRDLAGASLDDTWNFGVRGAVAHRGFVLRLGYAQTGNNGQINSFYGTPPSYVDLQKQGFNRVDEKVLLATLSYDFERVGVPELRAILYFAAGFEGEVGTAEGDEQEVDVVVDYRLGKGLFEDLWLRFRGAYIHDDVIDRHGTDFQLILRYEFPLI